MVNDFQSTCAVVTPTIGRPELERAILSVRAQTYPCRHYVFVDGVQYADAVRPLQQKYPEVVFVFLPFNTGAGGWCNSRIIAAASCLLGEDILCFLDDDNWYLPEHVAALAKLLAGNRDLDFAYSLRSFYDTDGSLICDDHWESLGFYRHGLNSVGLSVELNGKPFREKLGIQQRLLVDTNCYAFRRDAAVSLAPVWLIDGRSNDANVFRAVLDKRLKGSCSGCFSVCYVADYRKMFPATWIETFDKEGCSEQMKMDFLGRILQKLSDTNAQAYLNQKSNLPWLESGAVLQGEESVVSAKTV